MGEVSPHTNGELHEEAEPWWLFPIRPRPACLIHPGPDQFCFCIHDKPRLVLGDSDALRALVDGKGELGPHDSIQPQVERLRLWATDPEPEG